MVDNLKDARKRHENTPLEGTDLSDSEAASARKDGAKDAVKESAKENYKHSTGTENNETEAPRFLGSDEIMMWADTVDLGIEAFKKAIAEDGTVPEDKVAGIYKLERNGKNRTDYVKALRDRLGLKKGENVPGAGGPDYTNDITAISDL